MYNSIDIKIYKLLCEISVSINKKKTIEFLSNHYLQVIRPHPLFLKKYSCLLNKRNFFLIITKKFFLNFLSFIKNYLSFISDTKIYRKKLISLNQNSEILVISHLMDKRNLLSKKDFYFDNIKNETNSIIFLINHTRINLRKLNKTGGLKKNIFSQNLGFFKELKIFLSLLKEFFYTLSLVNFKYIKFKNKFIINAAVETFSWESCNALRIGYQIEDIVLKIKPKLILTTFEGHSWERVVFSSAKRACINIKCIGYQHAAIFENQSAMFNTFGNNFDPNIILTISEDSKKIIKAKIRNDIPVYVFGSNRSIFYDSIKNGKNCLVIPEGIIDECIRLFSFSLEAAKIFPNIKFIWRTHPLVSLQKLIKNNSKFSKLPKNIILSSNALSCDILNSKYVLYRGSTAVIQSTASGLIPIYLSRRNEPSIDPVFQIKRGKYVVEHYNDLIKIFKKSKTDLKRIKYCKNFYSPLNFRIFDELV